MSHGPLSVPIVARLVQLMIKDGERDVGIKGICSRLSSHVVL